MDPREALIHYYRWLRQYGYNDSHSGNASVRDGARIWVTPTGACADTLAADGLVACTLDGGPGERASLDAPLHLAVYRRMPDTGAVLHSHNPYTIALTMGGDAFVPDDFEGAYYFGHVPVVDIDYGRHVEDAPVAVSERMTDSPVVVVRGHGVYARGASLDVAYKWTCTLELSAKTSYLARQAGTVRT